MQTPPLFLNKKEFLAVSVFLLFIIFARLFFYYQEFLKLPKGSIYYSQAKVIQVYNSKLLKLQTPLHTLFLKTKNNQAKPLDKVYIKYFIPKELNFFDYLKGFFAKGEVLKVTNKGFDKQAFLAQKIASQHQNKEIASFYQAIYLAQPLDRELRKKVSNLGISHLIALSGFHLGILWALLYGIFYLPYSYLQKRLFPWRHKKIDLGLFTLLLLGLFVLFTNSPPSLLRSYFMLFALWLAFTLSVAIFSFEFLATITLILLALFPKLLLSWGFILSVAGVFYIFLLLKYLPNWAKRNIVIEAFVISFGVFLLMFPFAHFFFGNFSMYQLSSPLASLGFSIFYPISILLHLVSFGDMFDKFLKWYFNLGVKGVEIFLPLGAFLLYLALSFWAIFSKRAFLALLALAGVIFGYYIMLASFSSFFE